MLALLSICYLGSISLLSEFGFRSGKKMKDNLAKAWYVPFDFLFFYFLFLLFLMIHSPISILIVMTFLKFAFLTCHIFFRHLQD